MTSHLGNTHSIARAIIVARALHIRKSLGALVAARYMRNCGAPIEAALDVLTQPADTLTHTWN